MKDKLHGKEKERERKRENETPTSAASYDETYVFSYYFSALVFTRRRYEGERTRGQRTYVTHEVTFAVRLDVVG